MIQQQATKLTLALVAFSVFPRVACSDGMIFQLPKPGVWVRYKEQTNAEGTLVSNVVAPKKVRHDFTRLLTVKSLDRVRRHDQLCRWIEIGSRSTSEDVSPQPDRVLKLLIPEEYLRRGEDPLSHAVKTFFNPSPFDRSEGKIWSNIEGGFNRVQYEIDRIRPVFPKPLSNAKSDGRETLELHGRKWENCEILTGTSKYDGPLSADGRAVFEGTYRLSLHPDAPFGIVAMKISLDGLEYSKTVKASLRSIHEITLVETGQGAVSTLETMKPRSDTEQPVSPVATQETRPAEEKTNKVSKTDIPQIRELDRICNARDADAFQHFVLLGSPVAKPAIDFYASQVESGGFSVIDIQNAVVGESFVRVSCTVSIAGRRMVMPFDFVERRGKWRWLIVVGADRAEHAKAILTDAEWKAWSD